MNTLNFWSNQIQGIQTLYSSRKLRFNKENANAYQKIFNIDQKRPLRILEIGCGPGALCQVLKDWYPNANVIGVDRDQNFIEFAKDNIPEVEFLVGDIYDLPFEENSFDVIISNTVVEHIETSTFFKAQYHSLKSGGVCLCLSQAQGTIHQAPALLSFNEEENTFWQQIECLTNGQDDLIQTFQIGKYKLNEQELPQTMEKFGFQDVSMSYITTHLTPDNPTVSDRLAHAMIESDRLGDLEILDKLFKNPLLKEVQKDIQQMITKTNQKYDKRWELYQKGQKQWDTKISTANILRGIK
ncbi:class I SAM-dependent methyltransferase [Facklamia miroungae]|uniref:Ubiquinone/menaquinone biosynthesis C-methylase UbiE n=1 Tax=Facklamia miroungae TaxID=120956 RepID=A0A1G7QI70_9LACT|nr:class I SAM-dependent methyltransferase [Facklamia miroungae]NKZ28933.1 class I SAM-dependent methyltransferase [Facklamia miroungae]SDF97629.1 Ubiquinone/menaquinone biosynthesis C-methylase UbiE [Facklamia miroungae]